MKIITWDDDTSQTIKQNQNQGWSQEQKPFCLVFSRFHDHFFITLGAKKLLLVHFIFFFLTCSCLFLTCPKIVRLVEIRVWSQLQTKESCEGVFEAYSLTGQFLQRSWSLSVFWVICFACRFFTAWLCTKIIFLGLLCWTNWGFFDLRSI